MDLVPGELEDVAEEALGETMAADDDRGEVPPLLGELHPVVRDEDSAVKEPAWLNDVTLYHNRGNTTFTGENSLYGDFFGLDDLFTERKEVVDGMIEIYQYWIARTVGPGAWVFWGMIISNVLVPQIFWWKSMRVSTTPEISPSESAAISGAGYHSGRSAAIVYIGFVARPSSTRNRPRMPQPTAAMTRLLSEPSPGLAENGA